MKTKEKIIIQLLLPLLLAIGNIHLLKAQTIDTAAIQTKSVAAASIVNSSTSKTNKIASIVLPVSLITYGVVSLKSESLHNLDINIRNTLLEHNEMLYNTADNYVQYTPAAAAFALNLCGVKSTHKLPDMVFLYAVTSVIEVGLAQGTKHLSSRMRPDSSSYTSFPSGHTATAFAAAEFLHQEYKDQSPWISIGGYGMATLIGASRIYNNKHWLSDVIAGAGTGILSAKLAYWIYPSLQRMFSKSSKKEKKYQALVCPTYDNGALGFQFAYRF